MIFPPGVIWELKNDRNEVYLTFDDGPEPDVTPFVLDSLREFGMKGTFFCIGSNVMQYPELFQRIISEGHAIGNHTMNHENGMQTSGSAYLSSIEEAVGCISSPLFRPPYGRIKHSQMRLIREKFPEMKVIMWSVISGDFDESKSGKYCFEKVKKHTRAGGIIVFHDSNKAYPRLKEALPLTLEWLKKKGLKSVGIPT